MPSSRTSFVLFVFVCLCILGSYVAGIVWLSEQGSCIWGCAEAAPAPTAKAYVLVRYSDVYQGGIEVLPVPFDECEATAAAMSIGVGAGRIQADCVKVGQ